MASNRKAERVPISLAVSYRTPSAFLVSYSVNLSKGGLFLESDAPLPIGTPLELTFSVPIAGELRASGHVTWIRGDDGTGLPRGMGVEFAPLDERYGDTIDKMAREYVGLSVLVAARNPDRLSLLGRYVRAIISCEVIEASDVTVVAIAMEDAPDLVVVDLEHTADLGTRAIELAKRSTVGKIPVIALTGDDDARRASLLAGADAALVTPPSFHDLQAAVIRVLARPDSTHGR